MLGWRLHRSAAATGSRGWNRSHHDSRRPYLVSPVQGLIDFLSQHPALSLGVAFAAALLKSVAVIGTVIPGSSVVFGAGVLIGLQALDPWGDAGLAVIGAILGDGFSYWLGHLGSRIWRRCGHGASHRIPSPTAASSTNSTARRRPRPLPLSTATSAKRTDRSARTGSSHFRQIRSECSGQRRRGSRGPVDGAQPTEWR